MNLPSDTPRLPKWIFLLGEAALLTTAWFVWDSSGHPVTAVQIAILAGVAVAAVLGVIPFVADYARRQDEALDNRQRSLQSLGVTIAAAAEQISIAATGLQGISEAAQESLGKSEKISERIQERMAELHALVATVKKDDGEAAAKLESVAKKIARTVAEFEAAAAKALEASRTAQPPAPPPPPPEAPARVPEAPPVPLSKIVEIRPVVASSDAPFEGPPAAPAPSAAAEAAPAHEPPAAPAPRKRAPRRPSPPPEAAAAPADLVLEAQPRPEAPVAAAAPAPEGAEQAPSSDGATRLVITAYIGIGNRLFIRGEGPGLSWEKGVPLSFVSIGKWRWETSDASRTVRFKLYKNDDMVCDALGEGTVEPGTQKELSAAF